MSPLAFLSRPSQWLRAIHRHRGTISGGPNFSYELCLRRIQDEELDGLDLSSWRFAFNGAEPVSPETMSAFEERFARCGLRPQLHRAGVRACGGLGRAGFHAAGRAAAHRPHRPRRIYRARGARCPRAPRIRRRSRSWGAATCFRNTICAWSTRPGSSCPTAAKASCSSAGPRPPPATTATRRRRSSLFSGEWVNTGDRAYMSQGMVYITGREKDIIIKGGRNISPYELEEAIGDLPRIRRGCVAVFGSVDRGKRHRARGGARRDARAATPRSTRSCATASTSWPSR